MSTEYTEIEMKKSFAEEHPNIFLGAVGAASLVGTVAIGAGIYWLFGKVIGREIGKEINQG